VLVSKPLALLVFIHSFLWLLTDCVASDPCVLSCGRYLAVQGYQVWPAMSAFVSIFHVWRDLAFFFTAVICIGWPVDIGNLFSYLFVMHSVLFTLDVGLPWRACQD